MSDAEREAREITGIQCHCKHDCGECKDCRMVERFVEAIKRAEHRGGGIFLKNANELIVLLRIQVEHHKRMRRNAHNKGLLHGAEIWEDVYGFPYSEFDGSWEEWYAEFVKRLEKAWQTIHKEAKGG